MGVDPFCFGICEAASSTGNITQGGVDSTKYKKILDD